MKTYLEILPHAIALLARREDMELRHMEKSIFSVPERAFVYLVAKTLVYASPMLFHQSN